jgi:Aspartyl protease/Tetratricopeptide repeat
MVELNRRSVIAGIGLAAGTAAVAPLLNAPASAAAEGTDPDALLKAGRFDEAARGYEEILRQDPNNAHAVRQRGYIALLSNRFADAEKYLALAVRLAPDDKQAKHWLADCYLRQDKYAPAAPLLRAIGDDADATWYGAVKGQPYQLSVGPTGRVPWLTMDPLPTFEASVNGLPPKSFGWDTGDNVGVGLTVAVAKEAGLKAVAQTTVNGGDQSGVTMYFGVLDSFRMGDVELRNIPVSWSDLGSPQGAGTEPGAGAVGAQVFAHFVTTLDWADQALIFRPRTAGQARAVRAKAARAGCRPLPLWIDDFIPYTRGSVNGSGPQVVCVNTGQDDGRALGVETKTAERLKVRIDQSRPMYGATHGEVFKDHPCYPDKVGIGPAVARGIYCAALDPRFSISTAQFDVLAAFGHTFFKPYAVTLDFAEMNLYIT